jgi:hypothetical protein
VETRATDVKSTMGAWRWLRWYPLAAAALIAVLYWLAPKADEAEDDAQLAAGTEGAALQLEDGPVDERETGSVAVVEAKELDPELEEQGWIAEQTASAVASALSERVGSTIGALGGRFSRDVLKEGGLKAARLAPFIGPFLRYQRARASYASDDPEVRAAAERQTVVALAELALDAGVTGVGHVAADSEGLIQLVEGAVDLADMVDLGLSIQREFGAPLGALSLGRLDDRIDQLAGLALTEIDGLAPFVRSLLTAEVPDWRGAVPDDAIPYVEELLTYLPDLSQLKD